MGVSKGVLPHLLTLLKDCNFCFFCHFYTETCQKIPYQKFSIFRKIKISTSLPCGLWQKILRFVVYISFIYVVALIPYHIFTCFSRKVNLCGIDLVNVYNANASLSFKCFRKNLSEKRLPYILHFHLKQSSKKYKNLFLSTLRGESFVELLIFTLFTKKCTISY